MEQDDEKLGRLFPDETEKIARAIFQKTSRSGRVSPDGRTRTYHLNAKGLLKGKSSKAVQYVSRSGIYEKKSADLQSTGGCTVEEIKSTLEAVEDATFRKNGRVAVSIVFELPMEMLDKSRELVTENISNMLNNDGFPNHWAIHTKGKNGDQPHVHFLVSARAFVNCKVVPEGRPGKPAKRFLKDRSEVRKLRETIAEIINVEQLRYGGWQRFHAGRLRDTGISRPALPRVPEILWKSKTKPLNRAAKIKNMVTQGNSETHNLIQKHRAAWAQKKRQERLRRAEEKVKFFENKVKKVASNIFEAKARVRRISKPRIMRPPTVKQQTWIKDVSQKLGIKPPDVVWEDGGEGMAWIKAITGAQDEVSNSKELTPKVAPQLGSTNPNVDNNVVVQNSSNLKQALIRASKLLKQREEKPVSAQPIRRPTRTSTKRKGSIGDE